MKYGILQILKELFTGKLELASPEVIVARKALCGPCEVRNITSNTCTACGCWISSKVRLKKSVCPLEKW